MNVSFRPISPVNNNTISPVNSNIPDHTFGRTERFIDKCSLRKSQTTKELSKNSTIGPGTYDLRLNSTSSQSPIFPYEKLNGPKMCHQQLLPEYKSHSPPPGTYEIQRFPSPLFQTISNQTDNNKNTYSFNNKSRNQPLGSSTCNGESKFYNESKWDDKLRSFSPNPLTYDVKNEWKNSNSPFSIADSRVSSPLTRNSNHSKPWNDYKINHHHIKTESSSSSSSLSQINSNKNKINKKELLEKQKEISEVIKLPKVFYL